jgi:hypothetical protein
VLDLDGCLDLDPKGKIAKTCAVGSGKISSTLAKKCVSAGVDLAAAFPGCNQADALDLAACLAAATRCGVCRTFRAANDLPRDCDAFDDGVSNASCL